MGTKRALSLIAGTEDVAYQLEAFQSVNSCILSVSFELTVRTGRPDLVMILQAFTISPVTAERVPLALSRFNLSALRLKRLEDAITYGLYQIDAQLARIELDKDTP